MQRALYAWINGFEFHSFCCNSDVQNRMHSMNHWRRNLFIVSKGEVEFCEYLIKSCGQESKIRIVF